MKEDWRLWGLLSDALEIGARVHSPKISRLVLHEIPEKDVPHSLRPDVTAQLRGQGIVPFGR
jgi:hypothetical protein